MIYLLYQEQPEYWYVLLWRCGSDDNDGNNDHDGDDDNDDSGDQIEGRTRITLVVHTMPWRWLNKVVLNTMHNHFFCHLFHQQCRYNPHYQQDHHHLHHKHTVVQCPELGWTIVSIIASLLFIVVQRLFRPRGDSGHWSGRHCVSPPEK